MLRWNENVHVRPRNNNAYLQQKVCGEGAGPMPTSSTQKSGILESKQFIFSGIDHLHGAPLLKLSYFFFYNFWLILQVLAYFASSSRPLFKVNIFRSSLQNNAYICITFKTIQYFQNNQQVRSNYACRIYSIQ